MSRQSRCIAHALSRPGRSGSMSFVWQPDERNRCWETPSHDRRVRDVCAVSPGVAQGQTYHGPELVRGTRFSPNGASPFGERMHDGGGIPDDCVQRRVPRCAGLDLRHGRSGQESPVCDPTSRVAILPSALVAAGSAAPPGCRLCALRALVPAVQHASKAQFHGP